MKNRLVIILVLLFLAGILFRAPLIEKTQSHWDGPQYSIAIKHFDLFEETPAPPGYPIYIFLGWMGNLAINDPHKSLLFIGVFFSGLTTMLFFIVGRVIFNQTVGILSSLLYLSGPAFYYLGLTAYPYSLLTFFSLALGFCVYGIVVKKLPLGILLGIVGGLFFGFRPQELPMILPLGILGLTFLQKKERVKAVVSFFVIFLMWFIPTLIVSKGLENYVYASQIFFEKGAIAPFSVSKIIKHFERIGKGFFLSFTLSLVVVPLWIAIKGRKIGGLNNTVVFFIVWILPSFVFNVLIRTDHAGYQMTYLSAFVLLISYFLYSCFSKRRYIFISIITLIMIFNLFWFFRDRDRDFSYEYIPTSFHYSEIVKNDRIMQKKISFIKETYDPYQTVVITKSQTFRPVMYYLIDYEVVNINALETIDPQFSSIVRVGRKWQRHESIVDDGVIKISPDVKHIVFFDNEFNGWVRTSDVVLHTVDKNLYVISIANESLTYYISLNKFSDK